METEIEKVEAAYDDAEAERQITYSEVGKAQRNYVIACQRYARATNTLIQTDGAEFSLSERRKREANS